MSNDEVIKPLFKDKKAKDGWVLNLVQNNETMLTSSLYDAAGKLIEGRAFNTQEDKEILALRQYVILFEGGPEANYKKMTRIDFK